MIFWSRVGGGVGGLGVGKRIYRICGVGGGGEWEGEYTVVN